ncbi:SIS domain-containing protein [Streptococcus sp. zg-86]|uniref:SIS domain-containing protein n=1 Tax=Streptococcus zhangguiae TaxID=2664091 RepID=A0A6I4R9X2_9STRE|nr:MULTISPECIES: MurR/RpiR family transcriptional regulator [unclassified Streptococcus]MTB63574.1 SIS domain-containing protein [Streptococcus sp. zg-86]MTB89777.1 SIS domain-containing protein [Streptococcus sp. zg-36]MWV55448.1 SIS domain-containing protein [Streptococcus sp. zg-70]QTH47641.1 MurR/RpiR family transcriptional regulator [Streptococcus sp. zg-86]
MTNTRLTDTEEYIWRYINQHFDHIAQLTISELSEAASVSNASIIRTLKKKGFGGFTDFKHDIQLKRRDNLHVLSNHDLSEDTQRSIVKNYQEVIRTLNMIDVDTLEKSIPLIHQAEKIILFARGFSELIASEMLVKFQLVNKYCELHTDPNIIRPISKRLSERTFVIMISLNGETKSLVDAAKNCVENQVPTLLISANQSSSLAKLAPLTLFGFKTDLSYFPDFEVHSRLPLFILSRILLDAYAASLR